MLYCSAYEDFIQEFVEDKYKYFHYLVVCSQKVNQFKGEIQKIGLRNCDFTFVPYDKLKMIKESQLYRFDGFVVGEGPHMGKATGKQNSVIQMIYKISKETGVPCFRLNNQKTSKTSFKDSLIFLRYYMNILIAA